ncbi:MAG: type II secretion system F family protein [Acidimicrobiia bacterium]
MTLLAALATAVAMGLVLRLVLAGRRARRRRPPSSGTWLKDTGLDVTPAQFWATSLGAGVATYVVVFALTSLPIVALMPSVVVATLPRAYFLKKRAQRLDEVQRTWPDGLRDLLATVRSGASLPTAIEGLATFGPLPLRTSFQGFAVYSRSLGVVPALEMVKSDLADPTSDRVIEVLILAYEDGGAVVLEILSDLAEATTRDVWTLEEIRTEVLEQKINSRIVFVLPWLVLVAMTARSGAFREFYASSVGIVVAAIGGVMSLLGVVIASRLGGQPPEPRVFASARGNE